MRFSLHLARIVTTFALLGWLGPPCAAAQEARAPRLSLNWVRAQGAEACVSSQQLASALTQRLGPVLVDPAEADLAIEGIIGQPTPGKYQVEVRLMTAEGHVAGARTLQREAEACSALTPAILLVLTLTIDPAGAAHGFPTELLAKFSTEQDPASVLLSTLEQDERAAVSSAEPAATPVLAPRADQVQPAPAQAREGRVQPLLQVGPALAVGLLPAVTWGASLSAGLDFNRRFSAALSASYWAQAASDKRVLGGLQRVSFSAASLQAVGCAALLSKGPSRLSGCLGGTLGLRWVSGSSLSDPSRPLRALMGPVAQLSLRHFVSLRWYAALDVAATLLFPRDRFSYRDVGNESHTIYQPSRAAAFAALAVGVRL